MAFLKGCSGVYNVREHGAVGRAGSSSIDDTPAIQSAIAACRADYPQGGQVVFPAGDYRVSSINCAGAERLSLVGLGGGGSVRLYADAQATPAPVINFESADSCTIKNISVNAQTPSGNCPSVIPSSGFYLGHLNKVAMYDCASEGYFADAALLLDNCTNSNFYSCAFQIDTLNASPLAMRGSQYCNENRFFGCEFHAMFKNFLGTAPTLWAQGITNFISFHGCLICCSGPTCSFVKIDSPARDWLFESCKFYSESGGNPAYVMCVAPGIIATGISFAGSGYIPNVTPQLVFLNCGEGARVPGMRLHGWSPRDSIAGKGIFDAVEYWMNFSANDIEITNGQKFVGQGFSDGQIGNARVRVRRKGVLVGMRADAGNSPGAVAESYLFSTEIEGQEVYECVMRGSASSAQNLSSVASINPGEAVDIRVQASAAAVILAAANIWVGVIWAED